MAQHGRRERCDIVHARRQAPIEQRARPTRQHQRLGRARSGAPDDIVAHQGFIGRFRAAVAHQSQDGIEHGFAHRHRPHQRLGCQQLRRIEHPHRRGFGRPGGRDQHAAFAGEVGIGNLDLQEKPIQLRFGQRVGAFLLDRVLRRQHVERLGQAMFNARDADPAFLHRLQKCGLGARAGAVDFVRHQELAEHRPRHEAKAAPAVFVDILGFKPGDFRWHQIGGELDAVGVQAEHHRQGFHQPAFAQARHADQQHMAAGEQADQGLVNHVNLAMNGASDLSPYVGEAGAEGGNFVQAWVFSVGWHGTNPAPKGKKRRLVAARLVWRNNNANSGQVGMLAVSGHWGRLEIP